MRGNEATDAIRDEMAKSKNDYIRTLGELMTEYLRIHPEAEIPEKSTLEGAYKALQEQAKKKVKGECYTMPPMEIFNGLMEHYGLKATREDAVSCFMGAIGQNRPDAPTPAPAPAAAPAAQKPAPKPADDLFDLDALMGV